MLIPLIPKDPNATDFSCRDGEIEFQTGAATPEVENPDVVTSEELAEMLTATTGFGIRFRLTPVGDYPTANIRIPLQPGDADKVTLMMQGQISRVDAATADRITDLIVRKASDVFQQLVTDNRRLGLQMLPYRVFAHIQNPDGTFDYPSAQAVMLPSENPPHPEITAYAIADETLNLSLRFPVKTHRMEVVMPEGLDIGYGLFVYVSYPLYIPDKDEISGTLGSVRSATGGNSLGIRFSYLTTSRMKYSVAAPEKYYLLTGNEKTGYHIASKAADLPDYSKYAEDYGFVPPFPAESLRPLGSDIDPMDWIADWEQSGKGYLPVTLPYLYRILENPSVAVPKGVDSELINSLVETTGYTNIMLTRPMTFAKAERSRHLAEGTGVERMRIHGLPKAGCVAVLLGSNDGVEYKPLRSFNPHATCRLLTPPRLWHRLLLLSSAPFGSLAIEI